jgi:subtilisin family serine protease
MIDRAPDLPYAPDRARGCLRGRVVVKLAPGHARDDIPHYLDVRRGSHVAGSSLDGGGAVDRVLRRHVPALRVTSAFRPARAIGSLRGGHWDELEVSTGLSRTFRIDFDPELGLLPLLGDLAELGAVDSVCPQYLCCTPFALPAPARPADPLYAQRMVGVDAALAYEPGDRALIVGLVDSGVDLEHTELKHCLRRGADTVDLPPERLSRDTYLIGDTAEPDRIPRDEMGHGTACASIMCARGQAVPRGLAGAAWLLPMRALAAARVVERTSLTALGAVFDIDEALKRAVDLGARVLNLTFGTPEAALREDDPRPHADVVEYALRRGCVLVAASGNDGHDTSYFPAAHPGVIAVGSVGEGRRPSRFSTRGQHVALSAPGEHVRAAALNGYASNTGTSFASPFVAGAAALLVARAARYGVALDAATVRELLTSTAASFAGDARPSGSGSGILDAPAALHALERVLSEPDLRAARAASALTPESAPPL